MSNTNKNKGKKYLTEQPRHKKAKKIYFELMFKKDNGEFSGSVNQKVAEATGYKLNTINKWSSDFNWKEQYQDIIKEWEEKELAKLRNKWRIQSTRLYNKMIEEILLKHSLILDEPKLNQAFQTDYNILQEALNNKRQEFQLDIKQEINLTEEQEQNIKELQNIILKNLENYDTQIGEDEED